MCILINMSSSTTSYCAMLEENLLFLIFTQLPQHDLLPCGLVCRDFHRVIASITGPDFCAPIATVALNYQRFTWADTLGGWKPPWMRLSSWPNRAAEAIVAFGESGFLASSGLSLKPEMFLLAAKHGNLPNLVWAHKTGLLATFLQPEDDSKQADCSLVRAAVEGGHLSVLEFLRYGSRDVTDCSWEPYPWNANILRAASRIGRLTIVEWLATHGLCPTSIKWSPTNPITLAARHGHLECAKFMVSRYRTTEDILDFTHFLLVAKKAASGGHRHVFQWTYNKYPHTCYLRRVEIISAALERGHSEFSLWLLSLLFSDKPNWGSEIDCLTMAIKGGCVSFLTKMLPSFRGDSSELMVVACRSTEKQRLVIYTLLDLGVPVTPAAFIAAASKGDIHLLKYLASIEEIPTDNRIVRTALQGNFYKVLFWALDNGCAWHHDCATARLRYIIAMGGLDRLISFVDRGYIIHPSLATEAAESGQIDILRWLCRQGCKLPENVCDAAASCGHLDALKFCHFVGAPIGPSTFASAARWGELEVIRWLHKREFAFDETATAAAYAYEEYGALRLLISMGCTYDPDMDIP